MAIRIRAAATNDDAQTCFGSIRAGGRTELIVAWATGAIDAVRIRRARRDRLAGAAARIAALTITAVTVRCAGALCDTLVCRAAHALRDVRWTLTRDAAVDVVIALILRCAFTKRDAAEVSALAVGVIDACVARAALAGRLT
ncbi:MAG: hypothetical protein H7Z43_03580 [Clostridia bacterium]|nr:hypothetical protein [Deltaproteobacteria bacterium]